MSRPSKITIDSRGIFRKRHVRFNYAISRNLDEFSCEGEARVKTGKSRLSNLLNSLTNVSDILKGYEPMATNGYALGISKMEYKVSDSFPLNSARESIGAD